MILPLLATDSAFTVPNWCESPIRSSPRAHGCLSGPAPWALSPAPIHGGHRGAERGARTGWGRGKTGGWEGSSLGTGERSEVRLFVLVAGEGCKWVKMLMSQSFAYSWKIILSLIVASKRVEKIKINTWTGSQWWNIESSWGFGSQNVINFLSKLMYFSDPAQLSDYNTTHNTWRGTHHSEKCCFHGNRNWVNEPVLLSLTKTNKKRSLQ